MKRRAGGGTQGVPPRREARREWVEAAAEAEMEARMGEE